MPRCVTPMQTKNQQVDLALDYVSQDICIRLSHACECVWLTDLASAVGHDCFDSTIKMMLNSIKLLSMVSITRMHYVQNVKVSVECFCESSGKRHSIGSIGRAVGRVENPSNLQGPGLELVHVWTDCKRGSHGMAKYFFSSGTENKVARVMDPIMAQLQSGS